LVIIGRGVTAGALLALMILAGCGGRHDGFLIPLGDVQSPGRRIDLLVATTRSSVGASAGQMFTGERSEDLAFADISVSVPPDAARQIGEVQWPDQAPGDPAKSFVTLRADRIDLKEALRRFHVRIAATPKRRALVFVHGYNTRFEEAVYRLAQIVNDSHAPVTPILFTWPSRGKLLAYAYDRESANYSRDALENVLQALAADPAVDEIAVLAHSMGNWITLEALRQMAIRNKTLPKKIGNVMLAAPDVDVDVFRRQIAAIDASGYHPPFTLFVSQDDDALAVSSRLWGGTTRLGAIDPDQEPYRTLLAPAHLTVIDLTKIRDGDRLGHGKFAESPEIVQMIGLRLAAGQPLSDGKPAVGDHISGIAMGATGIIGTAASLAISAPIAIVDHRTRDSLSDRIEDLWAHTKALIKIPTIPVQAQ
jgi:esterase/lipase superfamily enzyme